MIIRKRAVLMTVSILIGGHAVAAPEVLNDAGKAYLERIKAEAKDQSKADWMGTILCGMPDLLGPDVVAQTSFVLFTKESRSKCVHETFGKATSMAEGGKVCRTAEPTCDRLDSYPQEVRDMMNKAFLKKKIKRRYLHVVDSNKRKTVTIWGNEIGADAATEICNGLAVKLKASNASCISPQQ